MQIITTHKIPLITLAFDDNRFLKAGFGYASQSVYVWQGLRIKML